MNTIYYSSVDDDVVRDTLDRMTSQVFKLLPMREEGEEWIKPLHTIALELLGMSSLFPENNCLFSAVCKLEGAKELGEDMDFMSYRRMIFEVCGLLSKARDNI